MSDPAQPDHRSIGDVLTLLQVEFTDISISKIRFLESQGLINPERTPSGYRRFYDTDVDRLRWILIQQRDHFLPLKVIKDRLDGRDSDGLLDLTGSVPVVPPPIVRSAGVSTTNSAPITTSPARSGSGAARSEAVITPVLRSTAVARGGHSLSGVPVVVSVPVAQPLGSGEFVAIVELCGLSGLSGDEVKQLETHGLLTGKKIGNTMMYDADCVAVAQLAARFYAHGVQARHLRMFKLAVEREMGVFEAASQPHLRNNANGAKRKAVDAVVEMANLAEGMHAVLMRKAARRFSDQV